MPDPGNDHRGLGDIVDRSRFGGGLGEPKVGEVVKERPAPHQCTGLVVEEILVLHVEPGGGDGHRAVEVNGQLRKLPAPDELGEAIENLLGATDRERGDEHLLPLLDRPGDDLVKFIQGLFPRPMIAIAVRRLHEDQIGMLQRCRIADDGRSPQAKIARKNYHTLTALVVDRHFDAGRAENMAGVDQANGDTVGDLFGLSIRHGNEKRREGVDIRGNINRRDRFLAGADQPARVLFGVGLLEPCRVMQHELGEVDRS